MSTFPTFISGKAKETDRTVSKISFAAHELPRGPDCQATLLIRGADLSGHGNYGAENEPQPDLCLDKGTVRLLSLW